MPWVMKVRQPKRQLACMRTLSQPKNNQQNFSIQETKPHNYLSLSSAYKIYTMRLFVFAIILSISISSCQKQTAETTDIPDIAVGCNDGIQNGDEQDIDCGGTECGPCTPLISATVDADTFSTSNVTSSYNNNVLFISGTRDNPYGTISLNFIGTPTIGTFTNKQGLYLGSNGVQYTSSNATISFSKVNLSAGNAEGTFSFTALSTTPPVDSVVITNGLFRRISF